MRIWTLLFATLLPIVAFASTDSSEGERLKALLAGKKQSDSFGWFALRDFTYCLGGVAPDPLSKPIGIQPKSAPATLPIGGSEDSNDLERMIGTGDSVVVLYHPVHRNKPVAWCNTLVAFDSTHHVSCHRALPTCQRCQVISANAADDATVDKAVKEAVKEFQDYCENKLTLAVRADCPLHLVQDWNDEPPFDLVRFCMVSSADDGFTLKPATKKPKGVVDPTDPIVPSPNNPSKPK